MSKLTQETFELLQDGLDALVIISDEDEISEELVKKIQDAEDELIAIGTF